jgi:hypothetical protein
MMAAVVFVLPTGPTIRLTNRSSMKNPETLGGGE